MDANRKSVLGKVGSLEVLALVKISMLNYSLQFYQYKLKLFQFNLKATTTTTATHITLRDAGELLWTQVWKETLGQVCGTFDPSDFAEPDFDHPWPLALFARADGGPKSLSICFSILLPSAFLPPLQAILPNLQSIACCAS